MSEPVPPPAGSGLPAALFEHYQESVCSVAYALKVIRKDEEFFGITSLDQDVTIKENDLESYPVYSANTGMTLSSYENSVGYAVGNFEVTTLNVNAVFTQLDLAKRLWDGATYKLFRFNWVAALAGTIEERDCELMSAGILGELSLNNNSVVIECRDLRQFLQQPIGSKTSKICRWRLGSTSRATGGLCHVDLNNPDYYRNTSVAVAYNQLSFNTTVNIDHTDPPDWDNGIIEWTSGNNTGLRSVISSCIYKYGSTSKDISLSLSTPAPIQAGDTFKMIIGCKGRLEDDCYARFNNAINFGGEPHLPTVDALTKGYAQ